jgi:integrase
MKLTKQVCDALTLPDGKTEHIAWDDDGFGLRLRRSSDGSKVLKSWTVQYRHGGRKPRIKLGDYPVLELKQARDRAKAVLAQVALGKDPAGDKRERREKDQLLLRSLVDQYLAEKQPDWAERSYVEAKRYLTDPKYFGPLHRMAIDTISLKDVAARVVAIKRIGNPTAARARSALTAFFVWAMQSGLTTSNPTIGSISPQTHSRDRVLSGDELAKIWKACGDDHYGKIVRLLILLGARRQEIGGLAHSECDLDGPQPSWTLPAARSKNGKAHKLPLMPMALAVIRSLPRLATRDRLFGTSAAYGFSAWAKGKRPLDQRSGVGNWTIHDLRRSTATGMADIGIAPHIIEHILNHQSGHRSGVAGIYNRSNYERETRTALALWEDHIRTLVAGGERVVVPFTSERA